MVADGVVGAFVVVVEGADVIKEVDDIGWEVCAVVAGPGAAALGVGDRGGVGAGVGVGVVVGVSGLWSSGAFLV